MLFRRILLGPSRQFTGLWEPTGCRQRAYVLTRRGQTAKMAVEYSIETIRRLVKEGKIEA
jgi:hypothetical protein